MGRTIRRVALALGFVLLVIVVILVIAIRPDLQDKAHAADQAWQPLVQPLGARYVALTAVADRLDAAGAEDREVTKDLRRALRTWSEEVDGGTPADQAHAAARLEGLAARVEVTVKATPRLAADGALTQAVATFRGATPAAAQIRAYNAAVTDYQKARRGMWARIVAALDGYDPRPTLQLAPTR